MPHLRRSILVHIKSQAFRPWLTFGGPALRASRIARRREMRLSPRLSAVLATALPTSAERTSWISSIAASCQDGFAIHLFETVSATYLGIGIDTAFPAPRSAIQRVSPAGSTPVGVVRPSLSTVTLALSPLTVRAEI